MSKRAVYGLLDRSILRRAAADAFRKLGPRKLVRNPVMFVTGVVAAFVTSIFIRDVAMGRAGFSSPGRLQPGCGSPFFSPILLKPSRKAVAGRKPMH